MNWTFAGAMSYVLLFQGSTWLTELLTSKKYPEYKDYQKLVGMFVPKVLASSSATERKVDSRVANAVDKKKK